MLRNLILAAALSVGVAACATAMTTPVKTGETALGTVLVDGKGMTLYTFDKDTMPGKSVCNGPCAQNWPPLPVSAGAEASGDWSVVSRDDGSKQWAYKGKPLYTWVKDQKPGDTTGNGFLNNAWHVAKP
ncbi:COG4315 family predicted lipoprotein [Ferrovibrio xuzhouensis]|uniref:Lipoprotein with Yx(FWY)xxD motif n=1 Tax=Ferrovibrio xuzhouensis TaxID=1576914 RepID=A0ABV7V9I9_9PROT